MINPIKTACPLPNLWFSIRTLCHKLFFSRPIAFLYLCEDTVCRHSTCRISSSTLFSRILLIFKPLFTLCSHQRSPCFDHFSSWNCSKVGWFLVVPCFWASVLFHMLFHSFDIPPIILLSSKSEQHTYLDYFPQSPPNKYVRQNNSWLAPDR